MGLTPTLKGSYIGDACVWAALVAVCLACGCQRPTLAPMVPNDVVTLADGGVRRIYDTDGDGDADFAERLSTAGRVVVLEWDSDRDGEFDQQVVLEKLERSDCRELLIILDSVPYTVVEETWRQGRLRYFYPPSRVISPFPVMTDLSLSEFFGVSPTPGVESAYYDGRRLTDAYSVYFSKSNSSWMRRLDHRLSTLTHSFVYLWPYTWLLNELYDLEQAFLTSEDPSFVSYMISPSAVGARYGRDGHQTLLITIDRFCQALMHRLGGRLRITLMSDHGHSFVESRFIRLAPKLAEMGYQPALTLREAEDIVVPEFSVVSYAGVYTQHPARVAADIVGLESVGSASYLSGDDEVVVLSKGGRGRIARSRYRLRYVAERGDPLRLVAILEQLKQRGKMDEEGFVHDRDLFAATAHHVYPDALHRLWRAFHGLAVHPPDVLVSLEEGYYCGSRFFTAFVDLKGIHGSLRDDSSVGFAMTTAGPLPETVRMEDLAGELRKVGLWELEPLADSR